MPNAKWLALGIQDDVDAAQREVGARPVRDPRVLADLEADAHVADVEHEVADREPRHAVVAGALEHVDLGPAGHALNQRGS